MANSVKKATLKKDILEAAAELFKEKGYAATSVRELAQSVGLEASSLYNHIQSKEQMLQEICMGNANKFTDGIEHILKTYSNPIEQLEQIIKLHIDVAADSLSSVTVFNDEWKHLSPPYQETFLKMRKSYESKVLDIIKNGIESGVLRQVDPKITLYSFLTSLRWIHYWFKPGRISKERLYDNLRIIQLDGLKKE